MIIGGVPEENEVSESFPPGRRSRAWDARVIADYEQKLRDDAALETKWLRLLAAGKWEEAYPFLLELKKRRNEPTTESYSLPGGILATPDQTPHLTPAQDDFVATPAPPTHLAPHNDRDEPFHERLKISQKATVEEVLGEVVRVLDCLDKATKSAVQRRGIEAAIRVVQKGVHVRP
jgi:hypothetical protein